MWFTVDSWPQKGKMGNSHLGGHDMVGRVDGHGETLLPSSCRAGGQKSDRRRVWPFMERRRLPRKRRDPKPRTRCGFHEQ